MTSPDRLAERRDALLATYREIARTRMAGLPVCNPALAVAAIGFAAAPAAEDDDPEAALGILLTPWFMNLVHLPLQPCDGRRAVGTVRRRRIAGHDLDFIAAHEPALGGFAACSLFSPVFEFASLDAACATADAVLALLRPAAAAAATTPAARPPRRAFLFGGGRAAAPA